MLLALRDHRSVLAEVGLRGDLRVERHDRRALAGRLLAVLGARAQVLRQLLDLLARLAQLPLQLRDLALGRRRELAHVLGARDLALELVDPLERAGQLRVVLATAVACSERSCSRSRTSASSSAIRASAVTSLSSATIALSACSAFARPAP